MNSPTASSNVNGASRPPSSQSGGTASGMNSGNFATPVVQASSSNSSPSGINAPQGTQFVQLFQRVTECTSYNLGPQFSEEANDFVRKCLTQNPDERPTASELLKHPWVTRFGDSNTLCGCKDAAMFSRMMSNSASSFATAPSTTFNEGLNNSSMTTGGAIGGGGGGGAGADGNNNSSNSNNNANNSQQHSTQIFLSAGGGGGGTPSKQNSSFSAGDGGSCTSSFKPPLDATGFAHFVYEIRKKARERELAIRAAEKQRERELRHEQKKRERAKEKAAEKEK